MIALALALALAAADDPPPRPAPAPPIVLVPAETWTVDQIRFPPPEDKSILKAMEADHSMEAVVKRLNAANIPFQRGKAELDTSMVPPDVVAQIRALPKTEPFVVPEKDFITVNLIVARRPGGAPRPLSEGEKAAERLLVVMHADDNYRASMPKVMDAMIGNLAQGNGTRQADLRKIVSEEFGSVMLAMLPITHARNRGLLAQHFTVAELGELVRFYQSRLGEKVTATMPTIQLEMLQFSQVAGRAAMQAAMPRIIARMRASNMAVPKGV